MNLIAGGADTTGPCGTVMGNFTGLIAAPAPSCTSPAAAAAGILHEIQVCGYTGHKRALAATEAILRLG